MTLNNTYLCDTLRSDQEGNPKKVGKSKLKIGEMTWWRDGVVVVWRQKDQRDVLTMSIKHLVKMVDVKNNRDKVRKKPNIFSD